MTETTSHEERSPSDSSQQGFLEIDDFPAGSAKNRYSAHLVNIDRRAPSNTVFHIEDNTFTPSLPRASHWSIAWSDLMMTMFVLFLSMFVYQTANQEFLVKKTPEIIGGDTTEALQSLDSSGASFPFAPIHPSLPLITGGTVKKVEQVEIESIDPDAVYRKEIKTKTDQKPLEKNQKPMQHISENVQPDTIAQLDEKEKDLSSKTTRPPTATPSPPDTELAPRPVVVEEPVPAITDQFQEIYIMSQETLKNNKLDDFASIDIVPDKTVRIILTGDLLFSLGESELSGEARASLQKVVSFIQHTPYMINVVGHTDNLPMRSNRFISNWELSVARASSVARFLIDEIHMAPNQFVVSGYSSYRPIVANTTAENRAKNRRVEIIISKRLPKPLPATVSNLK